MHPSNPFAPAVFSQSPFDARAKTICEHLKKRKMFRRNAPVCPSLFFHLFLTIARGRLKNNKNPRQQNDVTSRIKTYSAANGQNVFGNSCYVTFARSLSSTLSLFFLLVPSQKRRGQEYLAIFCQRMQPQNNFRALQAHWLRNEFP